MRVCLFVCACACVCPSGVCGRKQERVSKRYGKKRKGSREEEYVCEMESESARKSLSQVFVYVLQCIAVCCSVLQRVAACCSVLHKNLNQAISCALTFHFANIFLLSRALSLFTISFAYSRGEYVVTAENF